eukprot:TRINITY_DN1935_c0_g1_i1.p1 TRINITY_DN1935_c0_g1~~TRINITY_DN1935_c0_g1_i1.p1  ORF type:complete len:504 (-),score=119.31 TRINITY_DN1935_c0_g1_i1:98-1609(-)
MSILTLDLVVILILAIIVGFALTWSIGANDVANSFATSVGAKVLTIKQAIFIATIFEFLGAFLMGSHVAETFKNGLINSDEYLDEPETMMIGMTSAMFGAFILIFIATAFKLPVSGTHAIVGGIIGFSIMAQGFSSVNWIMVGTIVLSWGISPVSSGIVAVLMFVTLRAFILRKEKAFEYTLVFLPFCYGITIAVIVFGVVYDGTPMGYSLKHLKYWQVLLLAMGIGILVGIIITYFLPLVKRKVINKYSCESDVLTSEDDDEDIKNNIYEDTFKIEIEIENDTPCVNKINESNVQTTKEDLEHKEKQDQNDIVKETVIDVDDSSEKFDPKAEELFKFLQILTAIFGSFTHGANDVANIIGPLAAVISIYKYHNVTTEEDIPWYVLLFGATGLVIGLATWGYRVIKTVGEDLTTVTPSRGFNIEFGSALTVLIGSKLGIPLSTTHCKVGAVVFVGFADGKNNIKWKTVLHIAAGWFLTLPISGLISALLYSFLFYGFDYKTWN